MGGSSVLAEPAYDHARPDPPLTRGQGQGPEQDGDQRGLPRPVGAGKRQAVAPVDLEVDRPEPEASSLDDGSGQSDDYRSRPWRLLDGEAQIPPLPGLLDHLERLSGAIGLAGFRRQLLGPIDPEATLGLVIVPGAPLLSPDAGGRPLALLRGPRVQLVALSFIDFVGLGGMAALVGPLGHVAAPSATELGRCPRVGVQLQNRGHRPSQELAVVRDDDHATGSRPDPGLESGESGEVEVVRRLIQQRDVEAGELDTGQGHLGQLPARQRGEPTIGQRRSDPQVIEDRFDAGVKVGHTEVVEPLEGELIAPLSGRAGCGQPGRRSAELDLCGLSPGPLGERLANRRVGRGVMLLSQIADGGTRRIERDAAEIGLK